MAGEVWLKWVSGDTVFKACHADVAGAQAQAAQEATLPYLGIFDGPEATAAKVADVGGGE